MKISSLIYLVSHVMCVRAVELVEVVIVTWLMYRFVQCYRMWLSVHDLVKYMYFSSSYSLHTTSEYNVVWCVSLWNEASFHYIWDVCGESEPVMYVTIVAWSVQVWTVMVIEPPSCSVGLSTVSWTFVHVGFKESNSFLSHDHCMVQEVSRSMQV